MIPGFRPMLAAKFDDESKLRFPLIASPKVDGIRVVTMDDVPGPEERSAALCRSLLPVPNRHAYHLLSKLPPGLDGEVVAGTGSEPDTFNKTQRAIMAHQGMPKFTYFVFDRFILEGWGNMHERPYQDRLRFLSDHELEDAWTISMRVIILETRVLEDLCDLRKYEEECLVAGFEGICLRAPFGKYKFGRSTFKEHGLIKVKRFEDAEAVVTGFEELYSNQNPQETSKLGHAERATNQANMVPMDTLGALKVRDAQGREFKIGSGFTQLQRTEIWAHMDDWRGATVTYKHQPHGQKDLPRLPIFKGCRDRIDIQKELL